MASVVVRNQDAGKLVAAGLDVVYDFGRDLARVDDYRFVSLFVDDDIAV